MMGLKLMRGDPAMSGNWKQTSDPTLDTLESEITGFESINLQFNKG